GEEGRGRCTGSGQGRHRQAAGEGHEGAAGEEVKRPNRRIEGETPMRRIFTTALLGIVLGACGRPAHQQPPLHPPPPPPAPPPRPPAARPPPPAATPPPPAPKPSMADAQQAVIKAYPANFTDSAKIGALYATDALSTQAGMPDLKGRDAIQAFHQAFVDANTN